GPQRPPCARLRGRHPRLAGPGPDPADRGMPATAAARFDADRNLKAHGRVGFAAEAVAAPVHRFPGSVKLVVFCGRMTMIKGSIVAIVSPMHEDGRLDFERYRALIDWHVAEGTSAIVAVGTTGESPTVDPQEHIELIRVAVEQAAGRVPVIAGTGGNSTREAVELTEGAARVGADATLQVVPYYNKPTQEGMCRHFETVAERGGLPVILYNVPGRTVADLSNESVLRLARVPNIIGLKESTGDIPRVSDLLA